MRNALTPIRGRAKNLSWYSSLDARTRIAKLTFRLLRWANDHVPFGVRSLVGVLFLIGGVLGFLPILGFWMAPLGAAFIMLDIPPTRARIHRWMIKLHSTAYPDHTYPDTPQPGDDSPTSSQ